MDAMGGTWGSLPCRQSTPRSCPCGCLGFHHVGACRRCHIVVVGTPLWGKELSLPFVHLQIPTRVLAVPQSLPCW